MQIHRISKGEMPPEGKYILIYVPDRPWRDSTDQRGVFWKVAKFVKGISLEERRKLENSDNPVDRERARWFTSADEFGNNRRPYYFDTFGPDSYFGQEVDIWCELPVVED